MKISVLWSSLASYSVAFFKELAQSHNCQIQLIFYDPAPDSPYTDFNLEFCTMSMNRSREPDINLEDKVRNFLPDCILMCSWNFPDYMKISKKLRKNGVFVISTIDHQWHGTLKQWLGVISSRWFLKPSIDCFLVAGDRQAFFAQKLGFDTLLYGLNAATVEHFKSSLPLRDREPSFLFLGRLSAEKGIKNLIYAYRMYRQHCDTPWELKIAGTGKLRPLISGVTGVKAYGFLQPEFLPGLMESVRCLILPSIWEPWGVVIHEAAAAGLPVIATYECGAVTAFVRDGINGWVIRSDPEAIKNAMLKLTECNIEALECFGHKSNVLAELWTPQKLASYFLSNLRFLLNKR